MYWEYNIHGSICTPVNGNQIPLVCGCGSEACGVAMTKHGMALACWGCISTANREFQEKRFAEYDASTVPGA